MDRLIATVMLSYWYLWLFKSRNKLVDDLLFLIWFLDILCSSDGWCRHFATCVTCIAFQTVTLSLLSFLHWRVLKTKRCTERTATMGLLRRVPSSLVGFCVLVTGKCAQTVRAPASKRVKTPLDTCQEMRNDITHSIRSNCSVQMNICLLQLVPHFQTKKYNFLYWNVY